MIKDSKYIIKRVIIGVLIALILSFITSCEVHAETMNISDNSKFNNKNIPVWYDISPYRDILFSYEDWRLYSGDPYNANFGYIDVCIYGGVTVNNNNADCSDGCLNNINLYDTGINCKIEYSNQINTSGRRYFIFFNIKKWGMKNADTLPYFQDYLTFVRTTGYDPILDFNMVFLSNEDLYVQYASNNRIQELIEQSNQSISNSTQSIINNQNQNKQDIIDNQNQNKQDIIDNQNSNTDKQIESQKVCSYIDKSNIETDGYYLNYSGTEISNSSFGITGYISINSSDILEMTEVYAIGGTGYCFYNINKTIISCLRNIDDVVGNINIPTNASYFRATIKKSSNLPKFKICKNGNQAMTDSINDLNDSINDSSTASNEDFNNAIDSVKDALPTNNTISSLITMPITFLQKIIDALNGTCSPIVIGELFDYNMTMPCINPVDYIGFIWNIIDVICSGFFAYYFGKKLVLIFHNITSMKEGGLKEAYD